MGTRKTDRHGLELSLSLDASQDQANSHHVQIDSIAPPKTCKLHLLETPILELMYTSKIRVSLKAYESRPSSLKPHSSLGVQYKPVSLPLPGATPTICTNPQSMVPCTSQQKSTTEARLLNHARSMALPKAVTSETVVERTPLQHRPAPHRPAPHRTSGRSPRALMRFTNSLNCSTPSLFTSISLTLSVMYALLTVMFSWARFHGTDKRIISWHHRIV